MPFITDIVCFINDALKGGTLDRKKLQPAAFHGLSTVVGRKKDAAAPLEMIPGITNEKGKLSFILPDDKFSIQLYHKLQTNTYSYEPKSYGNSHSIRSVSELQLVAINNSKISGLSKDCLEPLVLFGMPQHLSNELNAKLKIEKCLITPLGSIMDPVTVFRQEYPQSQYFLNDQMSMFSIRYRVEMVFSQACVNACLCD